jgi:hypothetical protein
MQFASQQRSLIMMLKVEHYPAPDDCGRQGCFFKEGGCPPQF